MRRTAMKRGGKKSNAWTVARAKLKKEFEAVGITYCEIGAYLRAQGRPDESRCFGDYALSFAHTSKRRNLTEGELDSSDHVVLCCTPHHDYYERQGEAAMRELLERVIYWRARRTLAEDEHYER